MNGERLAEARKQAGLSQVELAVALGDRYSQSVISDVERGRSSLLSDGLARAARELRVSTDYLLDLTDDPTPAVERGGIDAVDAEVVSASENDDYLPPAVRHIEVLEIAASAGGGADVYDETPVSRLAFREDWLELYNLNPDQCNVIRVIGDSMEPTLPEGSSILVDRNRREPRDGGIFVMRTVEGLVVKRVGQDGSGSWQAISDNPSWETVPMLYGTDVIGEVRWMGRTL